LFGPKNARVSTILDVQPSETGPYLSGYIASWEAPPFLKTIFKARVGTPTEAEQETLSTVTKEVASYLEAQPSIESRNWMSVQDWCSMREED